MHIIHIGYDDWAGLYVDGELVTEGHSVQMFELEAASKGGSFTFENATVDETLWYQALDDFGGRLPDAWDDIAYVVEKEDE